MDAQWQQYYWNHYLMQQHHQQLTNPDTTISPPTTAHHTYSPTGTYGPLTHALRTHHVHHSNPYVTPPYTPPSQHTPPPQAPTSQPEFPPPPPPPLPTAEPVTPPPSTFQHSPPPPPTTRGTTAPAPPPPHIPSPTPPVPDSWNPTEQHWDSNTLHGHQLHRTIQPTQWSRKAGVAGLPTFEVFCGNWLTTVPPSSLPVPEQRQIHRFHCHQKHSGVGLRDPFSPTTPRAPP